MIKIISLMKWNANKQMELIFEVWYGHLMISRASRAMPYFIKQQWLQARKGAPVQSKSGTVAACCTRHSRHRIVRLLARGNHMLLYTSFVLPVEHSNMLVTHIRNNVNINECK
jgi:hypothetical protein